MFEVQDLGGITVKGNAEPINTYRVLQRKAQPGRLRGIAGPGNPPDRPRVGIGPTHAAADRLSGGIGKLFCLVGEAGLGKSRLTRELWLHWRAASSADGLDQDEPLKTWYEAASFSYETLQPYALFQRLLRRMAGIGAGEAEDSAQQKVEQLIAQLPDNRRERLSAVFNSLLGLSTELEGEAFKEALFDSLPDFFRQRFATTPGVLVLDDIHWSDSASIELLLHLLPLVNELPLLLICIIRPDQRVARLAGQAGHGRDGQPGWQRDHLHPLSEG